MVKATVVLGASAMSLFVPGVPVGTAIAMALAALAGLGASRLHEQADRLTAGGDPQAGATLRAARLCDDGALALCVLAVLYAIVAL